MAPRLKVFRYADGFHAWTVAASSRPKALQAWGVERDLFRDGSAEEIDSGPDYKAALKSPGQLIERGLSVDVGTVARASPRKPAGDDKAKARATALEAELDQLDRDHEQEVEALERRRASLEAEASDLTKRQTKARDALKKKLKVARAKAG